MMIRLSGLTMLLLGCLLAAPPSAQAEPSAGAFSYRGQLTDNGVPANGHYDFEFALFAAATAAAPIDTLEAGAMEIHDGLLDVPLAFPNVANDGSPRWIEVRMRPAGSSEAFAALGPRQPLGTPPSVRTIAATPGPGDAYDVQFTENTLIGNSLVLLGNVNVPAGSYAAFVRMQVRTGTDVTGNSFRLDCSLSPGFDSGVYRVGQEMGVERYVTFQGAATLNNAGAIQFSCRDGNGHTDTLLGGKLTVMAVGAAH